MTVVAYDGKTIAADRRGAWDNEPVPHGVAKLKLLRYQKRRFIVSYCGYQGQAMRMFAHFMFGRRYCGTLEPYMPMGNEKASLLVIELLPDCCHKATLIDVEGGETDVTDANTGMGSGGAFASGAMDAGATARQAVAIAAKRNTGCGDGDDWFHIAEVHDYPTDDFQSIKEN